MAATSGANEALHPVAIQHLPMFITAPGQTDVLMVVLAFILIFAVLGFGVFYFRLHSLPEHLAHKSKKIQAELVALLCLVSLFTHMHIFWIIALVLAFIELPDFGTPLNRIAGSAEKLAGFKPGEGYVDLPDPAKALEHYVEEEEGREAKEQKEAEAADKPIDGAVPLPARTDAAAKQKERIRA
jgi:hypothetical protein